MQLHTKDLPRVSNTRWTEDEVKILVNEVVKTPDNLQSAFERTAKILPARTIGSIAYKYHQGGVKKEHSGMLSVISEKKATNNVKNKVRHAPSSGGLVIPITLSMAKDVMDQLSAEERSQVISNYIN